MNVKVQGSNNFSVSERMKTYIMKRLKKIHYFQDHINDINFHLYDEGHDRKVDVTLATRKFGVYRFQAAAREMYTAIDKAVHKMDVKIYREKSKITSHNKPGHQDMVKFYTEHEQNIPEPTSTEDILAKPTKLQDAYLHMKAEGKDFFGFTMLLENDESYPAFLRYLEDNILYLFRYKDKENYLEFSLETSDDSVEYDEEVREISLKTQSLLDAQKEVLENEYHFDLFIDSSSDKVSFLFKEENGKWKLLR